MGIMGLWTREAYSILDSAWHITVFTVLVTSLPNVPPFLHLR